MAETEIDILAIDQAIRNNFEQEYHKLAEYRQRLADLEKTYNVLGTSPNSNNHRQELSKSITSLRDKIENIESKRDYLFYIADTVEILQRYREHLKTPVVVSFIGRRKTEDAQKGALIQEFLSMAQKYSNIPANCNEKKCKIVCPNCDNKKSFLVDDGAYICEQCGCQQEMLLQMASYKDADRVNIASKYTYDRKVHFRDCINQYQGKQNCTVEQKVYDDLEKAFELHHLLQGDKNTKRETRFAKITKNHVTLFLKELGYSKHYENVTLIHYVLTGKKPDDISHLEDKLLADFDLVVETYDKLFKNKVDRVNFISTHVVLFQLLRRHKHPCRKEDFVILKTNDRKNFHNTVCGEIFAHLGWNYVSIL